MIGALLILGTLSSAQATSYAESMSVDDLRTGAATVVIGEIDGLSTKAGGPGILTEVSVEVRETWAGTPRNELVIEVPGGVLGQRSLVIPGAPRFLEGQTVLLFLDEDDHIVGFGQGAFLITDGYAWRGLDNAAPAVDGDPPLVIPVREAERIIR